MISLEQRISLINAGYTKEEIAGFEQEPEPKQETEPKQEPKQEPEQKQEPEPKQEQKKEEFSMSDVMKKLQEYQQETAKLAAAVQANAILNSSIPGGADKQPDAADMLATIIRPPRKEV